MKKLRLGALFLGGLVSYCIAAQPPSGVSGSQAEGIHGTLLAKSSEDGPWRKVPAGQVDQGSWLRTEAGSEAVIALRNDSHLRMAENTSVHISQSDAANARLEILEGKVLSEVPEHGRSVLAMHTPKGTINSSGGVTVVEVTDANASVTSLTGSASVQAEELSVTGVGVLPGRSQARLMPGVDMQLAVEGPDTRRRNKRRQPFVQGEETGPKRLGEDVAPSPSPSPAVTPPPTTTVQPTPPPNNPPVVRSGGGGEIWPYLVGAAALGTGAYFLFRDDDEEFNNNNNQFFVNPIIPASP